MRKKRDYIIITFDTTTAAMAMEKQCRAGAIPGRLIPLPTQISAGCGLSYRMLPEEYITWKETIESLKIDFSGVHKVCM